MSSYWLVNGIATSTKIMNVTSLRTTAKEPTNSAFTITSPKSQTQESENSRSRRPSVRRQLSNSFTSSRDAGDNRRMIGHAVSLQPTEKKVGLFSRRHSVCQVSYSFIVCITICPLSSHLNRLHERHRIPYLEPIPQIKTMQTILALFRTSNKYSMK